MKINYEEFKALEAFKKQIREELLMELRNEIFNLQCVDDDTPRDANTYQSEDRGFAHAIDKVTSLINRKL